MIAVFGLATGFATNYSILLLCRFWVGFGVGGLTVPFDTLTEFMPKSHRGTNVLAVEFFWTTETMSVVILAYFTLGQGKVNSDQSFNKDIFVKFWHEWRIFVILCAVPCIFSTLCGIWVVPESPYWLLITKKAPLRALQVLREAAVVNDKNPMELYPPSKLLQLGEFEAAVAEAGIMDLLRPKWIFITLYLWVTWIGFAFSYYGGVIATTMVFADSQSAVQTKQATYHFDYGALFVSNSAEIIGTAVVVTTVDTVGRIPIQFFSYLLGGIFVLTLCLLASSDNPDHYYYSMVVLAFGICTLMIVASYTT
mmetsp:Transcript_5601/g.8594  ORF Transcript_5601/g.8594 Transcript_5601/m.8594 type:complete len:309 (+) Transcript_5601:356-1282(+)